MYVYIITRHIFVCVYMTVKPLLYKQFNLPQISMLATFWQPNLSQGLVKKILCQFSSSVPERHHRCESRRSGHLVDPTHGTAREFPIEEKQGLGPTWVHVCAQSTLPGRKCWFWLELSTRGDISTFRGMPSKAQGLLRHGAGVRGLLVWGHRTYCSKVTATELD